MVSYSNTSRVAVERTLQTAASHMAAGRPDAAKRTLEASEAAMRLPIAWNILGDVHLRQGHPAEALAAFDRAIRMMSRSPQAHDNGGVALLRTGRAGKISEAEERVSRRRPDLAAAHTGRAFALGALGRFGEMLEALDTAAAHGAAAGTIDLNRALALTELGCFEEALDAYDRTIEQAPDMALFHHQRACLRLLLGDFEAGFAEHEWRRKMPDFSVYRRFENAAPQWSGEDIAGKRVLLLAEQGFGDAIQFARYVPLVLARGAEVTLVIRDALAPLMRASFPGVRIAGPGEATEGIDFQSPLLSLPLVFGTRLDTIPASLPYLTADAGLVGKWRHRLGDDGFKVGVAWSGNPKFPRDRYRSVPLAQFAPLAAIPGVRVISLQAVHGLDQLDSLPAGMRVETLGPEVTENPDGFSEIAAAMACLDLIVSSDTAVVHLAGALARPVWAALGVIPDWRWLLERSDSPWYPTMQLFRQTARGDWTGVFADMAIELARLVGDRPARLRL